MKHNKIIQVNTAWMIPSHHNPPTFHCILHVPHSTVDVRLTPRHIPSPGNLDNHSHNYIPVAQMTWYFPVEMCLSRVSVDMTWDHTQKLLSLFLTYWGQVMPCMDFSAKSRYPGHDKVVRSQSILYITHVLQGYFIGSETIISYTLGREYRVMR